MKFVDEVSIHMGTGDSGNGLMSFRREEFIEKDGPNDGDGDDGGSIYPEADVSLSTLIDYYYTRRFDAQRGRNGSNKDCTGAKGDNLILPVPVGTAVIDASTQEITGDLTEPDQRLTVARGSWHGLGNARFKPSTNRAPRQTTPGKPGEARGLRLELKVLANVGLLGLSNAGKGTFIHIVFAARPKVADYPFITLVSDLGVVSVGRYKSSVVADIPGLTEDTAEGTGLSIRFFKHPARTRIFLHPVDMAPLDESDPVDVAEVTVRKLGRFNPALAEREHWLVLSKMDQILDPAEREMRKQAAIGWLGWEGPAHVTSALERDGIEAFGQGIVRYLDECTPCLEEDPQYTRGLAELDRHIEDEARVRLQVLDDARAPQHSGLKNAGAMDDDNFDDEEDDDGGSEIFYVP